MSRTRHGSVPWLSLRRTHSVEVEDYSSQLAVAEYASIRAESLHSFATSQSIIQWSLATYGVLFAAGLVAASRDISAELAPLAGWMAAIIYGLLLPGLICAAAWSWIGEIRRMERTGVYLRGVERHIRNETIASNASVVGPLNWESFLGGDPTRAAPSVKRRSPYIGTMILFGGAFFSSIIFFHFWVSTLADSPDVKGWIWALVVACSSLASIFVAVCLWTGLGVIALGREYCDLRQGTTRPIHEGTRTDFRLMQKIAVVGAAVLGLALIYFLAPESVRSF